MATGCGLIAGLAVSASLRIGGAGTAYSNANARIGVGDDDTTPAASQTGIIGTAVYKAMDASFPSVVAATATTLVRATYAAGAITNAIKEVTFDNGTPTLALVRVVRDDADQFTPGAGDIVQVLITIPET